MDCLLEVIRSTRRGLGGGNGATYKVGDIAKARITKGGMRPAVTLASKESDRVILELGLPVIGPLLNILTAKSRQAQQMLHHSSIMSQMFRRYRLAGRLSIVS
jgi:hypothetical protein